MATWTIDNLISYDSYEGSSGVIYAAEYHLAHTEGTKTCVIRGLVNLNISDLTSFIAYSSVTQQNVIDWVKEILGSEETTALESVIISRAQEQNRNGVTTGITW